ncbi:hypothetical protein M404DRAFT_994132 [Pisolithus tinctorius Marx 270]|uniref:Uncharacterized protein n=1 Tax=Pisolithus tinctorius Marx 270 TaxID=870435 RepID=A0A0C3J7E4_PISTI|nr:hypothetical protein M404DRAFT_1008846 [Pisolithus tinctorius Marx 270]KIO12162.1 hypothetical protein M404DRAFT_994132 [Pisolithus tinctorius Marx 270]
MGSFVLQFFQLHHKSARRHCASVDALGHMREQADMTGGSVIWDVYGISRGRFNG